MHGEFNKTFTSRFPKFGTNKTRELLRLIHEISEIEKTAPAAVLSSVSGNDYPKIKKELIKRRYPYTYNKVPANAFYLPKYEKDPSLKADTSAKEFRPENIYYEKKALDSKLYDNAKKLFPSACFCEIESLKDFMKDKNFSLGDYNRRAGNLFITEEKYDFFKKCPCTSGVVNCGYSIMNTGMGCAYECSYCFLQAYQNVPGIVLPFNIDDYFSGDKTVSSAKGFFNVKRTGSGEFTDSLIFDSLTEFSKPVIRHFKNKPDIYFEFKTKSINTANLLNEGGRENIVAAWSVNSEIMQKENEHGTPSVRQRLKAAAECASAGFGTAFHFDPVIHYDNWRNDYKQTIDMIFDIVPAGSIKWISLGTLRMPAQAKTVIENRFPESRILHGEFILGKDYKLRYHDDLKTEIFRFLAGEINKKKSGCVTYLCMEEADIWKKSGLI